MSIQLLFRRGLTFSVAVAALSWGCGESTTTSKSNNGKKYPVAQDATLAKRTKTLKKIFRAAPSPMETARIIQKEGAKFDAKYLCNLAFADDDGLSSDQAIKLGLYGADLSYASIFQQNAEALKYLEAVKDISIELGVGSVLNDEVLSRAEKNRANRDSIVALVSKAFFDLNEQLKTVGHEDLSGLVVAAGWVEGLYLATRQLDGATDALKQRIAEQKLILNDVLSLIESYSESPAIEGMITQLQPVVVAFEGVTFGKGSAVTAKKEKGVIVIGGGKQYHADDETISAISDAIAFLRNNLAKAS
ncbi:MAG: hypothetical protein COA49_08975 [Bacteroidetes bacterium]|nr:MAG: hypothetical protein COA49_08975 [Bacteroidota bacterium]